MRSDSLAQATTEPLKVTPPMSTVRKIAMIVTLSAPGAPRYSTQPTSSDAAPPEPWNSVATTAMSIAAAESALPRRAVSARPSIFRPTMNRIAAMMYDSSISDCTASALRLPPGAEHAEHAIGYQVPADDVYRRQHQGEHGQRRAERAAHRRGRHAPDDGDARDRVGTRHQRRVQLRRDLVYQLEAEEHREHEDEQQQQDAHAVLSGDPSTAALTRSSRITPPCVSRQGPITLSDVSRSTLLVAEFQACSTSR